MQVTTIRSLATNTGISIEQIKGNLSGAGVKVTDIDQVLSAGDINKLSDYTARLVFKKAKAENNVEHIESLAKRIWDRDSAVRTEFGEFERYLAYEKAEADGKVHIIKGKVI